MEYGLFKQEGRVFETIKGPVNSKTQKGILSTKELKLRNVV